jgi:hypothetical protein
MTYRIGFDGAASAELTHLLRAVQNGLNGSGANLLTHVRAEEAAASAPSTTKPCEKYTKDCANGKGPIEPPNFAVIALIVVISLLVGLAIGYRLGKQSVASSTRT